jgi:hypothetical protein
MSRSIRGKLEYLESRADAERCSECRLRPKRTHAIYPDEEDRPLPEPEHCPECGRAIEVVVMRVVYE